MAEIKSTLDIIMERTKNLTMTDKEKASFRQNEIEGKAKGWIQKYKDGVIGLDTLRSDFEKERKEYPEVRQILQSQLLDCLRLMGDNGKILRLLEDVLGISTNTIKNTIQSLKHEMEALRIRRIESRAEELKKRKIYGSSVVPNPDHGGDWRESILEAELDLKKRLRALVK
jgi:DNA-binding CsgD family transcriptional regulator